MSVIHDKEAHLREAQSAARSAGERLSLAEYALGGTLPGKFDEAASLAMVSIAHSFRELCHLARLAFDEFESPKCQVCGVRLVGGAARSLGVCSVVCRDKAKESTP